MNRILIAYYGDDFTGSVDAMETLTMLGVEAALFLDTPTRDVLEKRFPELEAVGVAGVTRSMDVPSMQTELKPKFEALKQLNSPVIHYKTCSTFDSSPAVGNIGKAVEMGMEIFGTNFAPLILGTPYLKRFVAFGNLFATVGDDTYRIDRHPMMSKHPITPMDEGDVRLHIAKQTDVSTGLIDTLHLREPFEKVNERYLDYRDSDEACIVAIDTVTDEELPLVGRLIWENSQETPAFVVGSSGVEYCLAAYWQEIGEKKKRDARPALDPVDNILVMCGSATLATKRQIETAEEAGYESIAIDSPALMDPDKAEAVVDDLIARAEALISSGRNAVMYSTKGPDDPIIEKTKQAAENFNVSSAAQQLARYQGKIFKTVLEKTGLRRACVAGGDTSGYVCKELGIFALQVAATMAPGSPICRVTSDTVQFDGLELCLKAGQAGESDYFERVRQGGSI